jgi:hypothetical protein
MVNLSQNGKVQVGLYDAETLFHQQRALLSVCRAACSDRQLLVDTVDLAEVLGLLECMMLDAHQVTRGLGTEIAAEIVA